MTQAQIAWAKTHDWFWAALGDGTLWVRDRYVTVDGKEHDEVIQWTGSFSDLRDWAGY